MIHWTPNSCFRSGQLTPIGCLRPWKIMEGPWKLRVASLEISISALSYLWTLGTRMSLPAPPSATEINSTALMGLP